MTHRTLYLVMETDRPVTESGTQLRGCIAGQYPDRPLLHHHAPQLIYTYPRVQYRVIEGTPSVLGIDDGADELRAIVGDLHELTLGNSRYRITRKATYEMEGAIRPIRDLRSYRFTSPWIALSTKNYEIYQNAGGWRERKELLNRILIGNILSMAKGLDIVISREIRVRTHLDPVAVRYKGIGMTGFTGEFQTNVIIPEFFALGKGVSQGFGTVIPDRSASPEG
ncbi:hypothetical protein RJ53_09420 [Methanocalculus chunghsingensis]|uniref:DNA repair protein n=1 Tax=Methanocalculus chunghsingensis TaxID=156457 RepID=A0A8J7WBJ7_9EURY|nr:CRISPR-associated endonuclease Cas6 [Methanocalculus chunghsingensis]MBR1369682.1 hypothetical protein [Methanocalculus chunghsingensis]